MATKKTYIVKKDGEEIETLKTLTAAKTLADAEGAEVFCDGEKIYQGVVKAAEAPTADETVIVNAEPVVAKKPQQPTVEEPETEQYRLKALMNVREKPSKDAEIITTKPEGTLVRVLGIEGAWLHLIDDTYILYEDGNFAEKENKE